MQVVPSADEGGAESGVEEASEREGSSEKGLVGKNSPVFDSGRKISSKIEESEVDPSRSGVESESRIPEPCIIRGRTVGGRLGEVDSIASPLSSTFWLAACFIIS